MGSENSALKSYTLKGPPVTLPAGLAVHPAQLQDGRAASVFLYQRQNQDRVHQATKVPREGWGRPLTSGVSWRHLRLARERDREPGSKATSMSVSQGGDRMVAPPAP